VIGRMPSVDDMGDVDDDDDCLIFPLTDIDRDVAVVKSEELDSGRHEVGGSDGGGRTRRRCKSFGSPSERSRALPLRSHSFSASHHLSVKLNTSAHLLSPTSSSPKCNWMHALRKIRHLKDPWERFHIIDMYRQRRQRGIAIIRSTKWK